MPVDTKQNTEIFGDYEVVSKIADGGMGTVYKGRHRTTGEVVAIKVMSAHMAKNSVLRRRLEQEYKAAHHLNHPNIVRALAFGNNGPCPYLVMEYVEGESLGDRLERSGRIDEQEAVKIITQIAHGLQKSHKLGKIHRDVKPDNILVTRDDVAKLTDLGLVKELDCDLNLTRTGRGLGTPHFMAPEQFRNAKKADARCDIYSLGATLYQMVTGELPFKGCGPVDAWMKKINNELPAPRDLVPELTDRVDWAIRRAMSPDPLQRPTSCREFIEDLTGQSTQRLNLDMCDDQTGLWYLLYRDDQGVVHTVKGQLSGVRKSLKDWGAGSIVEIKAARTSTGPFEQLRDLPEFRDLVVELAPPAASADTTASELHTAQMQVTAPEIVAAPPPPTKVVPQPARAPEMTKPSLTALSQSDNADPGDTFKWFLVSLLAMSVGTIGFFLLPMIKHFFR